MEKRVFKRHIIHLPGTCSVAESVSHPVVIMDFCPGGMLLSFESPSQSRPVIPRPIPKLGDTIEIGCAVPTSDSAKHLQFFGRVVHEGATSAGITLIEPDFDALHILYSFAKDHVLNPNPHEAAASLLPQVDAKKLSGKAARALMPVCKEIAGAYSAPIAKEFLETINARLLDVVGTLNSFREKNACYDAINVFKKHGEVFIREFEAQMRDNFNNDSAQKKLDEPSFKEVTLSLVEDHVLEDWLAFSDTARMLETEFQETLTPLEQRLSVVFQTTIDKENNPFGPAAFSQNFHNALNTFTLERRALQISYAAYKDVLTGTLGKLYDELNQYLLDHGVLPELAKRSYTVRVAVNKRASTTPRQGEGTTESPAGDDQRATEVISVAPQDKPDQQGAQRAAHLPSPANVPQDWYQLVQTLGNFQQYTAQASASHTLPPAPTPGPEPADLKQTLPVPQFYSAEEMLRALSQIKVTTDGKTRKKASHPDIQAQLLAELTKVGTGGQPKIIPTRAAKALEVAANLFDSVMADRLVSRNVRPWLQQLSLPLFKIAIRDDSMFTDKSHAARQLLDRISQLELYGEGGSNEGMNAIQQRVNTLLGEIASAVDVTPELFRKVLQQVDILIRLQNKAYDENVKDVAAAFESEEIEQPPQTEALSTDSTNTSTDPELHEWQKKITRLKTGDWLLLEVNATPQRLRLAWIAKNRHRYVFVNVKGLKEAILTQDELAQQLRTGTAVVLDDGGEPLIDRAQYSMLQNMHSQLLYETTHDHLTGLVNRREFERYIAEALTSARQRGLHHTLYVLNLNQFSLINSTFGYRSGDKLLVEITHLLRSELVEHNILARIGGNEFGVLFQNSQDEAALITATRYREAIQNYRFTQDGKSLGISFSAALIPIDVDSESVASLLEAAEASCRIARGKGTNHIHRYQANAPELSRHRHVMKWVAIIDAALDQQSLVLRHQPIVQINPEGTSVFHSEVLLGVPDESGNLISPKDFVVAAEHYRRMPAVDRWVIENTFRWMVEHREQLAQIGGLAINLSGASLNEEGLLEYILDLVQKLNVPMDKVCFEVTETAGVTNLSNASDFILRLKQSGCLFSLDDFGCGMSSYAYLKNLPVDFLKIDGIFVKNMEENAYDYAVVKSITEVGHFMGKKIIAEHVENERILSLLRAIGVDYAQGYAIAKPANLMDLGVISKNNTG